MISQENRKTTGKNVRISEQNNVNIKMEYIIIKVKYKTFVKMNKL